MKKIASIIGILTGIVAIILAIVTFHYANNILPKKPSVSASQEEKEKYKTDPVAKSLKGTYAIPFGLGSILLVGGLGMICYFGYKLDDEGDESTVIYQKPRSYQQDISISENTEKTENSRIWICPKCGEENSVLYSGCSNCYATRPKPEQMKKQNEKKQNSNEWKCPNCGVINQNYTGTCGCGTPRP